jgi:molybdopterin-binding protein
MNEGNIFRGSVYGIIAGTISTIVIDIVALISLSAMGLSLASFFALIGRCLLTLIGATAVDPVWQ